MKILMIGAHQDDNEFRCGGLAHKYVKMGYKVTFLSMCNGCGGHHILTPEETTATRAKESAKVAELLGIRYDVWDIEDCNIVADLPTRKRLIRYIREYNPDIISLTDENGRAPTLILETPPAAGSLTPGGIRPYAVYRIRTEKEGFYTNENREVPLFAGVNSVQPVELIPLPPYQSAEITPEQNTDFTSGQQLN